MSRGTRWTLVGSALLAVLALLGGFGAWSLWNRSIRLVAESGRAPRGVPAAATLQPLPAGPAAHTWRERAADRQHVMESVLVTPFRQQQRGQPWAAAGEMYLRRYCQCIASRTARSATGIPLEPVEPALLEQGGALPARPGCYDPAIMYAHATLLMHAGRIPESKSWIRQAVEGFERYNYPPWCRVLANTRLLMAEPPQTQDEQAKPPNLAAIEQALSGALQDGTFEGHEQVLLDELVPQVAEQTGVLSLGTAYLQTCRTVAGSKERLPYAATCMAAQLEYDLAWNLRGSGFATSVPERMHNLYELHLGKARDLLLTAAQSHPQYPHAPAMLLNIAYCRSGGTGSECETWYRRAVAAQLDYGLIHRTKLNYLRPRWGGSYDELYDFGRQCLETRRFDTRLPWYFVHALLTMERDRDTVNPSMLRTITTEYWQRPFTRQAVQDICDGYEREQPAMRPYWETMRAALLLRTGQTAAARRVAARLGDQGSDYAAGHAFGITYRELRTAIAKGELPPAR